MIFDSRKLIKEIADLRDQVGRLRIESTENKLKIRELEDAAWVYRNNVMTIYSPRILFEQRNVSSSNAIKMILKHLNLDVKVQKEQTYLAPIEKPKK